MPHNQEKVDSHRAGRSSFAMSLSLAEVFLLLIFATYLYFGKLSETLGHEDTSLDMQIERIKERLDELEQENKKLAEEKKYLDDLLYEILNVMGVENPRKKVWDGFTDPEARGHFIDGYVRPNLKPITVYLCSDDNTILDIKSVYGNVSAVIHADDPDLFSYLKNKVGMSLKKGDTVDWAQSSKLLQGIWMYEKKHNCRYFFNLTWASPEDYLLRNHLEDYLYTGKLIKSPSS